VQRLEGNRTLVDVMLSDHPSSTERMRVIQRELDSVQITAPLREQTPRFRALKAALSVMAPAPKPRREPAR
jgi:hypothetical protein